jgi:asparagine synthase (glutamine-hydrolysing)
MTDERNWITFNGEIYNYRELRSELRASGARFRTETDTEVILKAYEQWGDDCVNHLRGIFAFGIYDIGKRRLFLARDHLGVKPLYLWSDGSLVVFASEVRAILATGLVQRQLDADALCGYLTFGSVQDPQTLIEGIRSLSPAHTAVWQNGRLEERRYWSLVHSAVSRGSARVSDIRMGQALEEAVHSQLVADVPLATFLSGGIDSTAIAALAKRGSRYGTRTVSVVFDEPRYDERVYARRASAYIGTEHHELVLSGEDVLTELPSALAAYDQPSLDGLNTYFVCKVTRQGGVVVALSGVGGDELYGGYGNHKRQLLAEQVGSYSRRLPKRLRRAVGGLIERRSRREATRRFGSLLSTTQHPYFVSRQVFAPSQVSRLLKPHLAEHATDWMPAQFRHLQCETAHCDPVTRTSAFEMSTYMLSTLLRDTDQMSMAHALEVRVPLLDHRLVELIFSMPGKYRISREQQKPLLTSPLAGLLPDETIRRPKQGFVLPFEDWIRGALQAEMRETFLGGSTSGVFQVDELAGMWREFEAGRVQWSRMWGIFVVSDWIARQQVQFS